MELEPYLKSVVMAVRTLTHSQVGSIFVYEPETDTLKFVAGFWPKEEALNRVRVPLDGSVAGQCFTRSRPITIQNAGQDERIFRDVDKFLGYDTTSILAVPLVFQHETIGVMEAVNKQDNLNYTEEDVTILELLASLAAAKIQNHNLQDQLQRAHEDFEELERMKKDFIAITSHELRTPLGVILGHASVLVENLDKSDNQNHASVITENALKLKKIIEDIENAEQLQTQRVLSRFKLIELDTLIDEVIASFSRLSQQKHITIITDLPEAPLTLEGDADKLAIALGNLIQNALTFTDKGGHVLVTAESLPGYAKVSVVDNGIGIPARDLKRVFERFYQVESHMTRRHGGMGLGLSIAKSMVEMHNGEIWAESLEGRGSNFSFLIPTSQTKSATKSPSATNSQNAFDFES
jgi:signal transduction histidine kinase